MDDDGWCAGDHSDRQLLDWIAKREAKPARAKAAMVEIYRRHAEHVYRSSWRFHRRLGGEPGIRDLVQEVFMRVWRSAATFDDQGAADALAQSAVFVGWLNRISTNLYIDRVRRDTQL